MNTQNKIERNVYKQNDGCQIGGGRGMSNKDEGDLKVQTSYRINHGDVIYR